MHCAREIQVLSRIKSVELFARSIDGFTALHEVAEQESPFPAWFKKQSPETRCNLVGGLFEGLEARGHNLVTFLNATDILNRSALHYLPEEGSVEMLKLLLEKCPTGMSVTGVDCHGFTPIHLAVRRGHTGVVDLLLHLPSMDANIDATVNASPPSGLKPWESDDLELCRPNLFLKAPKELPTAGNLTPLHFAAMHGHTEIVSLLLKWAGIRVAPLDTKGLSPFDYSIQNGHLGVVKLLLEEGEPFTLLNCDKQMTTLENLLHVAIQHGYTEIAVFLLNTLGLRTQPLTHTNTQFSNHQSRLLDLAARENRFKIIQYILKCQPEVDVNDSTQLAADPGLVASSLNFAALGGHREAARELLNHHNLDVNAKDNKKRTPLLCAMEQDKLGVVKALCSDPANRLRATEEDSDG
jgi:ankyrin repeat protein